jgi:hypothetical protein
MLLLRANQDLDTLHITAFQNFISSRYGFVSGLISPNFFINPASNFNPDFLHDSIFIQVLHCQNHWLTISNYLPNSKLPLNSWFVFDSLNNPLYFLNFCKPALKCLTDGASEIFMYHVPVTQQVGINDCGLLALAYALSLAMEKDPSKLVFDQEKIRSEFNFMIENRSLFMFSHSVSESYDYQLNSFSLNLN